MRKLKVLVADDEPVISKLLGAALRERDYETVFAFDGPTALSIVEKESPDVVILDKKMPKLDGLQVCSRLREWSRVPIVMLSGDSNTEIKIKCLEAGADDYICKPFDVNELNARISAILRRSQQVTAEREPTMIAGDLVIDFAARTVMRAGGEVRLTRTEYGLLRELAVNVGKVLSHADLLKKVWGNEYAGETEYLRVFINRLRAKLETDPANPRYIITTSGVGYMFNRRAPDRLLEHDSAI